MGIVWCFCRLGCFSASYGRSASRGMMKMQLRPESLGGGGARQLISVGLQGRMEGTEIGSGHPAGQGRTGWLLSAAKRDPSGNATDVALIGLIILITFFKV